MELVDAHARCMHALKHGSTPDYARRVKLVNQSRRCGGLWDWDRMGMGMGSRDGRHGF
jgi:hypothetical protein